MGTCFFYTVRHEENDCTLTSSENGCANVARLLHIDKKRVRRGSNSRNLPLPDSIFKAMQSADQLSGMGGVQ